ncbi:glutamate racemase [Cupriavidus sp. AU9028]|uniref:glutamate racemase n=1 Tax=Cupriavidus sp. AU9028 TaxID=2871157 RepID=UPI001C9679F0|nr:glutamate racemase [Cupriavidus sp. AU9028]
MSSAPIGIFDSGLGGLSVLREVRALLPAESLVYLADSAHAPYGEKPPEQVRARTLLACEWLAAQGCKALVVACNTATAQGIQVLRDRLPLPIVGVEPGLKPAAAASAAKVVGVLATASTLGSDKFRRLSELLSADCRFVCVAGSGLVARIEQGETDGPAIRALLHDYLTPMLDAGADTLVLGCTHYPFLAETIRDMAEGRLKLVDTGAPVARQLQRRLSELGLLACPAASGVPPQARYCSTGDAARLRTMLRTLLQTDSVAEHVDIDPSAGRAGEDHTA